MSIWTTFAFEANVSGLRAMRSENLQPSASSRSQLSTAMFEAWEPCMPIMPVVRGSRPLKPPPPMTVMATGASIWFAKRLSSPLALLRTTPPPQMIIGRFDSSTIWTTSSTSAASTAGGSSDARSSSGRRPGARCERCSERWTGAYEVNVWVTSFVMSRNTGPGLPERATKNAARTTGASSLTSDTWCVHFVIGFMTAVLSTSWNEFLPRSWEVTLQLMATTGELSAIAVAMPVVRFVAPGPDVAKHTPTRPVERA